MHMYFLYKVLADPSYHFQLSLSQIYQKYLIQIKLVHTVREFRVSIR